MNRVGGGVTTDQYGMTIVDLKKIGYKDEPFVLAKNVVQVFYVKDMSSKHMKNQGKSDDEPKCHIVIPGKRIIIGIEDIWDKLEDFDQFDDRPLSMLTLASCYPKRTLLTYIAITIKGHS